MTTPATSRRILAGLLGACATTAANQLLRGRFADAPRLDLLGTDFLQLMFAKLPSQPSRDTLYKTSMALDLASNSAYFSLIGLPRAAPIARAALGCALGAAMGTVAVLLPPRLGINAGYTSATVKTRLLTAAYYTLGGFAAALALMASSDEQSGGNE